MIPSFGLNWFFSQRRAVLVLLILGLLGTSFYITLRHRAFRWAALDLSLSRSEAEAQSERFLTALGFKLEGYQRATGFWSNERPVIYLEKSLGTAETNHLLRSEELPVWGWATRFFKPLQKEEFTVWWSPQGKLVGFKKDVLDNQVLPTIEAEAARQKAEAFIKQNFPADLGQYTLSETSSTPLAHRTDHSFTWNLKKVPMDLRIRLNAYFSGDQITSVTQTIDLPDSFLRNERKIASKRNFLMQVAGNIDLGLSVAMCIFLLIAWKKHWVRWRRMLPVCGILLVVNILAMANDLPRSWFGYSTEDTVAAFWASTLATPLLMTVLFGIWQILPFAASDSVGRTFPRSQYSLAELAVKPFYNSEVFLTAILVGFGAAGIHLGFVVLYYFLGSRFLHFYSPLDVPYDDVLSSALPWIQPLVTGLAPALKEETTYRLFAIPFLFHFTKRKWVSILLPAILWGFLHSSYYVEPIYARGLELSIVGIFFGFIFWEYGIFATISAHFIYNATVSSSLLLESDQPYLKYSSLLVIGGLTLPLLIAVYRHFRGKLMERLAFDHLEWIRVASAIPVLQERRRADKEPILRLRPPLTIALISILLLLLFRDAYFFPSLNIGRSEAINIALDFLKRQGLDVSGDWNYASLNYTGGDRDAIRFIVSHLDGEERKNYLKNYVSEGPYWAVRFFQPEQVRECNVNLNGGGEILAFSCREDEKAPGKTMATSQTKSIATAFLQQQHLLPPMASYSSATEKDFPKRKDITHFWVDNGADLNGLRKLTSVTIRDGKVSSFRSYFSVPEAFLREEGGKTFFSEMKRTTRILFLVIIVAFFLRSFFDRKLLQHFYEPILLKISLAVGGLSAIKILNHLPTFWDEYDTASSSGLYLIRQSMTSFGVVLLAIASTYFFLFLFLRLPSQFFPRAPSEEDLREFLRIPPWKWRGGRGAFSWALAALLLTMVQRLIIDRLTGEPYPDPFSLEVSAFSDRLPFLSPLMDIPMSVLPWIIAAIIVSAIRKYASGWALLVASLVGLLSLLPEGGSSWLSELDAPMTYLILGLIIFRYAGFHLPFYFWLIVLTSAASFFPWLFYSSGLFQQTAVIVVGGVTILVAALFAKRRRKAALPLSPSEAA